MPGVVPVAFPSWSNSFGIIEKTKVERPKNISEKSLSLNGIQLKRRKLCDIFSAINPSAGNLTHAGWAHR